MCVLGELKIGFTEHELHQQCVYRQQDVTSVLCAVLHNDFSKVRCLFWGFTLRNRFLEDIYSCCVLAYIWEILQDPVAEVWLLVNSLFGALSCWSINPSLFTEWYYFVSILMWENLHIFRLSVCLSWFSRCAIQIFLKRKKELVKLPVCSSDIGTFYLNRSIQDIFFFSIASWPLPLNISGHL